MKIGSSVRLIFENLKESDIVDDIEVSSDNTGVATITAKDSEGKQLVDANGLPYVSITSPGDPGDTKIAYLTIKLTFKRGDRELSCVYKVRQRVY